MNIPSWFRGVLGIVTASLAGCTTDTICITEPSPAITIVAFDAATGRMITDSASGFVQLGPLRSDLMPHVRAADGTVISLASFGQTSGLYRVVVVRPGYRQFSADGVPVESGDCFAKGPALTALMSRITPP